VKRRAVNVGELSRDLCTDFGAGGVAAIERSRLELPDVYIPVIAWLFQAVDRAGELSEP